MWSIVIFTEENSIEVVPRSWVIEEDSLCYWPSDKGSIQLKIHSCDTPDKENWNVFKVRFPGGNLKLFNNYLKARKACSQAEDRSSFSESEPIIRKRKKRMISSSSSESDKELTLTMPKYTKGAKMTSSVSHKRDDFLEAKATSNAIHNIRDVFSGAKVTSRTARDEQPVTPEIKSGAPNMTGMLVTISQELASINIKLNNIQKDVAALSNRGLENRPQEEFIYDFPLKTHNDMVKFNEDLSVGESFQTFVRYVEIIGGGNLQDNVYRIMRRLLTYDLGAKYSWCGKKLKEGFKNLLITKGIIDGILRNNKIRETEKNIEKEMASWLRHAPERNRKEKKQL